MPIKSPTPPERPMNNVQAREIFDAAAAKETNPERRANIELCREYLTNRPFRRWLENAVAAANGL